MTCHFCHQIRVFDSCRAHHHSVDAGIEQGTRVSNSADPSPHLDRQVNRRHHCSDGLPVPGYTGTGSVQIHHVEPRRPRFFKRSGPTDRVVPVVRFPIELPLQETHTPAVPEVNGREKKRTHPRASSRPPTKFSRILSPDRPDFSG